VELNENVAEQNHNTTKQKGLLFRTALFNFVRVNLCTAYWSQIEHLSEFADFLLNRLYVDISLNLLLQ